MGDTGMWTKSALPYYAGQPVEIGPAGWLAVVVAVVVAFFQLILLPLPDPPLNFIPGIIFTGLPLVTLMAVSGWRAPAIFGALNFKVVGLGLAFGLATLIFSFGMGVLVQHFFPVSANPAATAVEDIGTAGLLVFLARTLIQLVGEEAVTILPLLAVLWLCVSKFGLSRRAGLVIAVVVSTLWFAAMHLPTYNWNIMQCLGIIGSARIVLTLAYLFTRNLWVSSIAHIFNDWALFLTTFAIGHMPVGVEG